MENYKHEMTKLENYIEEESGGLGFKPADQIHHSQKRRYKMDFVKTVKFNPKSNTFEPFDQRTKTFYNDKEANKYITSQVNKSRKTKFLNDVGTETPQKDLEYLYAYGKLQALKNENKTGVWKIRNSFSKKIEGTDSTVYEQEWLQRIKNDEAKLLKLRAGTKYERQLLKQIKAKRDAQ
tara:strand:- start:2 stop:538 length:537 start_codon:yes stop_codon:yes gene_type:complete